MPASLIRLFLFFMCSMMVVPVLTGQSSLLFRHLKLDDGLSEATNAYVYKDSKGFVWISSINGLNRFDGKQIKVYQPEPSDSTAMYGENVQSTFFEDDAGYMWFCTYDAINRYDPKHDRFNHFYIHDGLDSLLGYHIFHMDSLHNLWLLQETKGVYIFNTQTLQVKHIDTFNLRALRAVAVSNPDGTVSRLYLYKPFHVGIDEIELDQQQRVVKRNLIEHLSGSSSLVPTMIIAENNSILWIAGQDRLLKYDITQKTTEINSVPGIHALTHFKNGNLMLAVNNQGLWEYDKNQRKTIKQYMPVDDDINSLLSPDINYIYSDRDGGLWCCITGVGISYAYPAEHKFKLCNPLNLTGQQSEGFNANAFIEYPNGEIFCATDAEGIYKLNRQCKFTYKWEDATGKFLDHNIAHAFRDSKMNIWISTFGGLVVIPESGEEMMEVTDASKVLFNGHELKDGQTIFSASGGGLYEVKEDEKGYSIHRLFEGKYDKEYIPIWQDKKGQIWLNEQLQECLIIDPVTFDSITKIPIKGNISGYVESDTNSIVWVASTSGLYKVDVDSLVIMDIYNTLDGLPCVNFSNILQDEKGKLWLSCGKEIIQFDPISGDFKVFSKEIGLPANQFSARGSYRFSDGEMWFASMDGITSFYPSRIIYNEINAHPQISGIQVNDAIPSEPLVCGETGATHIIEIKKLKFPYRQNTLSFSLHSLEYSAPEKNIVNFKMEGLDADWLEAPSGTTVRYPNLQPGTYLFKVRAANSDEIFSDEVRQLLITIMPPFYRTWWFYVLSALASIAFVAYIVYLNFSRKLEVQKTRLRLYENLHDDVGSRLTAIVLSAEEVIREDNTENPRLLHIHKVAKSIVGNMRRLVWAIDPENDSMNSMVQKIRYDKSLILDDRVAFRLDLPESLKNIVIPGEVRYQLTSILNEALNNISKYAEASEVEVTFAKKDNDLHMVIRDNGKGFSPKEAANDKVKASGYGLGNMRKRIARVKGNLDIQSAPGQGTTIHVTIPL